MTAMTSRRTRSVTHHHRGNARADPRRDRLGECAMDLPPTLDAPSDRCERSLGRGDAEPSAGYLPGVRLFPADCSRRIWVPTPICLGGVLGSPAGCGSTLTVTSVSSASASSRRMARDANARGRARAAVRGTRRGPDARYDRTVPRARCASRVARVGVGREPNQKRPRRQNDAFHRKMRGGHTRRRRVYGCFGRISRATFCTPGYSSPVHTTSKLSSRRRRITCHGPG